MYRFKELPGRGAAQLAVVLEDNQLPHGHLAPCGGVVVLEHIEDCLPQQGQILLGEAGGLAGQVGGDVASQR